MMFGGIIGVFVFYSLGRTGMAAETKQQYTWLSTKAMWYFFNKEFIWKYTCRCISFQ